METVPILNGAIIAGVVACAITTVLVQFGAAVGLTQTSPQLSPDANISPDCAGHRHLAAMGTNHLILPAAILQEGCVHLW